MAQCNVVRLREYVVGMRVPTLGLSVAPVIIGAAVSTVNMFPQELSQTRYFQNTGNAVRCMSLVAANQCGPAEGQFVLVTILCMLVALFLQSAANFFNDYYDGIRGVDYNRTIDDDDASHAPPRLVASGVPAREVFLAAMSNILLACITGFSLVVITRHWWLLLVGVVSIIAAWLYVGGPKPFGYHGLGELAAFIFFGPVATLGTQYALIGTLSTSGVYGGITIGLIAAATMAINNLRDIESDMLEDKRTLIVILGRQLGLLLIAILLFASIILVTEPMVQYVSLLTLSGVQNPETMFSHAIITCTSTAIVLSMAMPIATFIATAKRHFRRALPLCVLSALCIACSFVCYAIVM